ncbi:MAG: hypothetical protein JXQ76_09885, partial [Campylobacterales bacterium]|nr:hypothetical protein [Campylobacterales bacterium]
MQNILLVRSPSELIALEQVGYGWSGINFSEYSSDTEVINAIKTKGWSLGRKANMIKRFFNLKKGDIVVLPFSKSIAIAEVEGTKSYDESVT